MIYAKINNGTIAARDDSLDGFDLDATLADGFTGYDVPSAAWLQIDAGAIVIVDPGPAQLQASKDAAKCRIDDHAGEVRKMFVSPGVMIGEDYRVAEQAARDWAAGGYVLPAPADVVAYQNYAGLADEQAACDEIIAKADQANAWVLDVRTARLDGKKAVADATSIAAVDTAEADTMAALDAIGDTIAATTVGS